MRTRNKNKDMQASTNWKTEPPKKGIPTDKIQVLPGNLKPAEEAVPIILHCTEERRNPKHLVDLEQNKETIPIMNICTVSTPKHLVDLGQNKETTPIMNICIVSLRQPNLLIAEKGYDFRTYHINHSIIDPQNE